MRIFVLVSLLLLGALASADERSVVRRALESSEYVAIFGAVVDPAVSSPFYSRVDFSGVEELAELKKRIDAPGGGGV